MESNVLLKFVKPNGATFSIGSNEDWRFTKKNGLSGFGKADGTVSFTENVNADGGFINNIRFGKKDRTVKCTYLYADNNYTARKQFLGFFTPHTTFKVYLTYMGVTKWAEGELYKLQGSEDTQEDRLQTFQMTFMFANPFWKSVDDFGRDIAEVKPMAGFPYISRLNVGAPTGIFNFSREVILTNDGQIAVNPRIILRANGTVLNPEVHIGDGFVRILDTLEQGDEIELNFTATPPTVKKNGVNALGRCDRTSNFIDMVLKVGDTIASFDAENGSDNVAVTIYYNKLFTIC